MMIETLCRAGASLEIVLRLLAIHRGSFADQGIDWQKAARELTICCLVERDCGKPWKEGGLKKWERNFFEDWQATVASFSDSLVHQELVQSLLAMQQHFFADQNDTNWQMVCEEIVQPLNGWWRPTSYYSMYSFHFLVKCNLTERLNAIGVRKWRMEVKRLVARMSSIGDWSLETFFDIIHSKMVTYECEYPKLKEAAFLLELFIWKTKMDESMDDDTADAREQCRISCGAGIIIPNVLPFLMVHEEKDNASEDDDMGESSEEEDSSDEEG